MYLRKAKFRVTKIHVEKKFVQADVFASVSIFHDQFSIKGNIYLSVNDLICPEAK